jgi:ABC-type antimicrobial peptide transport system permease subunit
VPHVSDDADDRLPVPLAGPGRRRDPPADRALSPEESPREGSWSRPRRPGPGATAFLLAFFAALALLLTTVGVYGVLAYAVRTRTAEIGVRMALGARAADIRRMVLASGLRLAAWGMGAGLLAAAAATRLMRAILFGITPGDAPSYAAAVLLLGAAMLAAWVPARRATRVDPMTALRNE